MAVRRTVVYEVMRTNLILIMVKTVKEEEEPQRW